MKIQAWLKTDGIMSLIISWPITAFCRLLFRLAYILHTLLERIILPWRKIYRVTQPVLSNFLLQELEMWVDLVWN
jgi:hypothetical protein